MTLKAGVLGAGHLGKIHLKLLKASPFYELIGFHDPNKEVAYTVSKEFGYLVFDSVEELLNYIDVLIIVTPTLSHFQCVQRAVVAGKHVFIEKPISSTVEEAEKIISLTQEHCVKGQVGHVERFNPAFTAVESKIQDPVFIESHRLAQFDPRGTDVPVVLDLMIHDLDIILSKVPSEIKKISSSGVAVISNTPDIANARIEFENGCVANITTSRISMKNMRKTRFFQKNAYISVDFLNKKSEFIQVKDESDPPDQFAMILENAEGIKKEISIMDIKIAENNAILDELESFARSILNNQPVKVSLEDGKRALQVAKKVIEGFIPNTLLK